MPGMLDCCHTLPTLLTNYLTAQYRPSADEKAMARWNNWHLMSTIFDKALPTNEKFILLALARYADKGHHAFPSIERLAYDTALSTRSVQDILKSLVTKKAITRIKLQRSYHYQILPDNIPDQGKFVSRSKKRNNDRLQDFLKESLPEVRSANRGKLFGSHLK